MFDVIAVPDARATLRAWAEAHDYPALTLKPHVELQAGAATWERFLTVQAINHERLIAWALAVIGDPDHQLALPGAESAR